MRAIFLIALFLTTIFSGIYLYNINVSTCQTPLHYRLGTIDARFDLSTTTAGQAISQAVRSWEHATGRDLFIYDANAPLVINFVFDNRQIRVLTEESLRTTLHEKQQTGVDIAAKYETLNTRYKQLRLAYATKVTTYNTRLIKFNVTVANYNDSGGAPADVYSKLQTEGISLKQEANNLGLLSNQLKTLVLQLNALGEQGNQIIDQYNTGVKSYNTTFAETSEFTQGDYQGDRIDIYKFSDKAELVKVLMHELGHALGLQHVESSSSIMYYLMQDQPNSPTLTTEDLAEFKEVCKETNSVDERLQSIIKQITSIF